VEDVTQLLASLWVSRVGLGRVRESGPRDISEALVSDWGTQRLNHLAVRDNIAWKRLCV